MKRDWDRQEKTRGRTQPKSDKNRLIMSDFEKEGTHPENLGKSIRETEATPTEIRQNQANYVRFRQWGLFGKAQVKPNPNQPPQISPAPTQHQPANQPANQAANQTASGASGSSSTSLSDAHAVSSRCSPPV